VQTNEVGRSSALLGGLLHVPPSTGRGPAARAGASAGLNLGGRPLPARGRSGIVLGDPASPLTLDVPWQGALPPYDRPLEVVDRLGCDPAPLDPGSTEDR
jgi:hypothetical protein